MLFSVIIFWFIIGLCLTAGSEEEINFANVSLAPYRAIKELLTN